MDYISPRRLNYFLGKVKNYIAQKLNLKQDVISDLSEIRSNAQSGASAYHKPSSGIQKSDLSTDVQTSLGKADTAIQSHQDISCKQDVISDLATIRSGASAGSTALQPNDIAEWAKSPTRPVYTANDTGALPNTTTLADLEDATHKTVTPTEKETWNAKQDAINDLAYIRSCAALGATALQEHQDISGKQDLLVSGTNIKTVNNLSLVGSGNVNIDTVSAYQIRVSLINPIFKEAMYRGAICFKYSDTEWLPSARESSTDIDKELTTLDFDPFGQIFYYTQPITIPVGTSVNAAHLYQQYGFDFRYAFNAGNTLTPYKAVYVKCEPLVDDSNNRTGRVRLASGQPIVQDLPTTADGFVYIYLGQATSERNIFILLNHPVYEYRNGGVKLWIGD